MPSYDPSFFNIDPYYNDFDENKNFLKMLFKPGLALQARELSQMQSIIQNQLEKMGNFVFDDGSIVLGGQITEIPCDIAYISGLSGGDDILVKGLEDKIVTIENEGTTSYAKIVYGLTSPSDGSDIIYFQYLSGEGVTNSGTIQGFDEGITFTASISGDVMSGMSVYVDEGIRYSNGYFVPHLSQRIGVYEYDETNNTINFETPNSSIGFDILKSIVTSEQDETLKDPASGFYNFNAPGSDRFKIELNINQRSLTGSLDTASVDVFSRTDFIEFLRVVDGKTIKKENYPDLGEIEETFARRTYDESGNYIVDQFEHTMIPGPSADQLSSKLDSGKAYVFGYEFETIGSTKLNHKKARETFSATDVEYSYEMGPYFLAYFSGITAENQSFGVGQRILFDSYSGFETEPDYTPNNGVQFGFTTEVTTKDFIPGLTLYFSDNTADLTGGSSPGASAAIQAKILEVIPFDEDIYDEEGFTKIKYVRIAPPYLTADNWTLGATTSFAETDPFFVAAGASFESGADITFTGSDVSFFSTSEDVSFTGGSLNTEIGSARVRNIQRFSGNTYKIFLDDLSLNDGRNFSSTKRIFVEGSTGDPALYTSRIPAGLFSPENTSLVFEVPYVDVVKSIDDYVFMNDIVLEKNINTGDTTIDLDSEVISGLLQIGPNIAGSNLFYNINSSRIVHIFSDNRKIDAEISIQSSNQNDINPTQLIIRNPTIEGQSFNGNATIVIACLFGSASLHRNKSSKTGNFDLSFTGPDEDGYYYSYFLDSSNNLTDVASIDSITPALTGYILDTGQRNTYYDWSRIKTRTNPSGSFSAEVTYFEFSGNGPFLGGTGSNSSYPDFENIPQFNSPDGQTILLRNALDFRPVRIGSDETTFSLTGPYEVPTFINDTYEQNMDYTYFLPRVDKIILSKDKVFNILEGIPNENPIAPSDDPNSMTLYSIRFNPYTFDENDVSVIQEDNRRYTMRDIGNIERRLETVEYYSTLNSLEQEAKITPVFDDLGFELPKKAIIVDQFTGTESSDISNPDFYCSIDREKRELRPPVIYTEIQEENPNLGGGLTSNDGIVTFNFDEKVFLSNQRSNNIRYINSNSIVDFNGSVKLIPHCDPWFSNTKKPSLKTNSSGENDSWLLDDEISFSMSSDFEERGWFGKEISRDVVDKKKTFITKNKKEKSLPISKIKSFSLPQSNIKSTVERKTDTSIVPFNREKTVNVKVTGLKPNKLHYIFLEDDSTIANGITASEYGEINTNITIPANKYPAGKKLFRVIDNQENDISKSSSSADGIFFISGNPKEPEASKFTRGLITRRESSNSENITNNTISRQFERKNEKSNKLKDNLAQIFRVNKDNYSNGIYLNSIDITFASWESETSNFESKLPVKVFIKPLINGYPSYSKIIAESIVYDIQNKQTDGVVNFKFDHPIYLEPGSYAFELESNSSKVGVKTYVLPSGKPNDSNETGERENVIDPNIGAMILPKNVGESQKIKNEFITFNLNSCSFKNTGTSKIKYDIPSDVDQYINETRFHLEGSFIDPRYTKTEIGANSIPYNKLSPAPRSMKLGSGSNKIDVLLSYIDANISPAIDTRASNFILKKYKTQPINVGEELKPNTVSENSKLVNGQYRNTTHSKYITKTVKTLETANNVSVIFERRTPPGTKIEVFLKYVEPNNSKSFDDIPYVKLTKVSKDPTSSSPDDFIKTEYRHQTNLPSFNVFAVKIVFEAGNETFPSIKNLRATAV